MLHFPNCFNKPPKGRLHSDLSQWRECSAVSCFEIENIWFGLATLLLQCNSCQSKLGKNIWPHRPRIKILDLLKSLYSSSISVSVTVRAIESGLMVKLATTCSTSTKETCQNSGLFLKELTLVILINIGKKSHLIIFNAFHD